MTLQICDPNKVAQKPPKRKRNKWLLPPADEIRLLADMLYKGGLTPANCNRAEHLVVRIAAGFEVGLSPVQAINNIMVVNGRTSIWGDAAIALVLASDLLAHHDEFIEGDGETRVGVCVVARLIHEQRRFTFSVDEAKQAKLWNKEGPWKTYPDRMLKMRARAFALRDTFADVLCGLGIVEEQQDVERVQQSATVDGSGKGPLPEPVESGLEKTMPEENRPITDAQKVRLTNARPSWARSQGIDSAVKESVDKAWKKYIQERFNVTSALQLSEAQAALLIDDIENAAHEQQQKEIFGPVATS